MPSHAQHQRGRRAPRSGEEEQIDGDRHGSVGVCEHRTRTRTIEDKIGESTFGVPWVGWSWPEHGGDHGGDTVATRIASGD
jgi:hypothetical protein